MIVGKGTYGTVEVDPTDSKLVLKTFHTDSSQGVCGTLFREIRAIRACKHKHVIQAFDVLFDNNKLSLVLERMDIDLYYWFLDEHRPFDMRFKMGKVVLKQIARALRHVHVRGFVHRDIKPSNILLSHGDNDRWVTKLADFGSSGYIGDYVHQHSMTMGVCTKWYSAPELVGDINSRSKYTSSVDVYSLGASVAQIIIGREYEGDPETPDALQVKWRTYINQKGCNNHTFDTSTVVMYMLSVDPKERPPLLKKNECVLPRRLSVDVSGAARLAADHAVSYMQHALPSTRAFVRDLINLLYVVRHKHGFKEKSLIAGAIAVAIKTTDSPRSGDVVELVSELFKVTAKSVIYVEIFIAFVMQVDMDADMQ